MSNSKIIGRETMIARLIDFNTKRINRIETNELIAIAKLSEFSYTTYNAKSPKAISKEYDNTFAEIHISEASLAEIRATYNSNF